MKLSVAPRTFFGKITFRPNTTLVHLVFKLGDGGKIVNRLSSKLLLVCTLVCITPAAFGQGWPLPAKTPNTPVPCPASSLACAGKQGLLTAAYSAPIKTHVGRYLDSQYQKEWQFPIRTLRARLIRIAPELNRIYMIQGSTLVAYNLANFFTRLSGGEAMVPLLAGQRANPETYLKWDMSFYAEASAWFAPNSDGQDRLFGIDYDDRGYVYPAYLIFGWGALKDTGYVAGGNASADFPSVFQQVPSTSGDVTAYNIISVKYNGGYYVVVSPGNVGSSNVWYVGDALNFAHEKRADVNLAAWYWAKSADGTRIAVNDYNGRLRIYSNQAIVTGGAPIVDAVAAGGRFFSGVDSDGTNFYAISHATGKNAIISVFSPSGNDYVRTDINLAYTFNTAPNVRYGAGFLTVFGSQGSPVLAANVHLYRANGTSLSEISLSDFVAKYYSRNTTTGYTTPTTCSVEPTIPGPDVVVYKQGSKFYLMVGAIGLGDVYEIVGADTITPSVKSFGAAANPNSRAATGSGPFYGDQITFTSSSSASVPPSVNWSFGDGSIGTTVPSAPDITHQFGDLTAASAFPVTKTVTATSASDSTVTDSVNVPIQKPQIRIGILGRSELLFTQPNASSSAPIVTSDKWIDASDGALEGHYDDWTLDSVLSKTAPSGTLDVGSCGTHTLLYRAHYGPNIAFTMTGSDATFAIDSYAYTARPFAVAIADPTSNATNVTFAPSIRITTKTADLAGLGATAATYTWELLTSTNTVVTSTTGSAALNAIPSFVVPHTQFGSSPLKVRLTVQIAGAATSCTSLAAGSQTTDALSAPTATLQKTGCTNVGSPCSFAANTPNALWSYAWTATGPAAVTPFSAAGVAGATWAPALTVAGHYVINVVVSNAIGSQNLQTTIDLAQPACSGAPTNSTGSIGWNGHTTGCNGPSSVCNPGETIDFYTFGPHNDCFAYNWDFGDGTAHSTSPTPTHTYNANGTYPVKATITAGTETGLLGPFNLAVGSIPPPPPPPPPPAGCPTLTTSSVYIAYNGGTTLCSPSSGNCNVGENLTFSAFGQNGYSIGCGAHSYSWNFGDGQTSSAANPSHSYASAGTYTASLTIGNGSSSTAVTTSVRVAGSGSSCPTMTTSNVYFGFNGPTSGCTTSSGDCSTTEDVQFTVFGLGYNFDCATHTYTWNFGDGTASATGKQLTHKFASAGSFNVAVTVSNGTQSFQATGTVKVAGNSGVTGQPCSPTAVCLSTNGRYSLSVAANDGKGKAGPGVAVAQSGPFGYFSFPSFTGDATNPEVFVKVVEFQGKPWIFYAGLTNLNYTITMHDTGGSLVDKSYSVDAPPAGSLQSYGNFDVGGIKSDSCLPVTVERNLLTVRPVCATTSNALCLLDRFLVTLTATDDPTRSLKTGPGETVPVNKLFGFFVTPGLSGDPKDIQVFVKMVDARAFDSHFWLFLGGLTDLKLVINVVDTQTGSQNTYTKPLHSTCGWNDTSAFSANP